MKTMLKLSLGLAVFLVGGFPCQAQAPATLPHAPMGPAKPEVVLACLPPSPENWKMTESRAQNRLVDWPSTFASRKYLEVPPPPPPGQAPKVPGTTGITITDTGYWPDANMTFLYPKSGTGDGQERTSLDGYPAIRTQAQTEGGDENILVWVKQRFLVYVTVSHQDKNADEKWARLVDFPALLQIGDNGPAHPPSPLTIFAVDELAPSNSGSGSVAWFDPTLNIPMRH